MLKRMNASVLFDRPVDLKIHDVTPGGGVMTFGDKCAVIGFLDFYLYPSESDPCAVDIEQEWLDTECCPEAEAITEEDVAALKEIHEYSISTGEETGAPLCCPVKILKLTFDFMDENGNVTTVDCSDTEAVRNYDFSDLFSPDISTEGCAGEETMDAKEAVRRMDGPGEWMTGKMFSCRFTFLGGTDGREAKSVSFELDCSVPGWRDRLLALWENYRKAAGLPEDCVIDAWSAPA